MRQDVADKPDNEERFRDCIACDYKPPSLASFYLHRRNCQLCCKKAIEMGEFIKCPYCEYSSSMINEHLKKIHFISKQQIKEKNIQTHSLKYTTRMGEATKKAILSSPKERERRVKLLGSLNKTKIFREKASITAIKTSSRKDVQEQRSGRLKKWRDENPDKFCDIWKKMIKSRKKWKKSKPEIFLVSWLDKKYPDIFEWGKMIRSKEFLKTGKSDRKQVDFRSKDRSVFIEIDGPFHFENLSREKELDSIIINEAINRTIKRDEMLEKIVLDKSKTLIRIGYGCWEDRSGKIKEEVLLKVSQIIEQKLVGIYKLGECYGENNCF